jgi:lipopolysaccharide transport system ATP-binding protein
MDLITVENIGKYYKSYPSKAHRVLEWLSMGDKQFHNDIWVLRNISFSVRQGESVGIIGHNGAGKSTLLKIITGTTQPSEGSIRINGRVSALLELGMGLHSDFTGRQNVYMVCQLMGLKNHEIDALMPSIEDFAEIGHYMDKPLRTYSSGMAVRVAFAAATAVRPDILIVDEALSVGDAYFQHKSFNRIRQFREEGTTLLFVSHDPGAVKNLCDRAILLDHGMMIKDGLPDEVLDYYNAIIAKREADYEIRLTQGAGNRMSIRSGTGLAEIISVSIQSSGQEVAAVQVGEMIDIVVKFRCHKTLENPTVGIALKDRLGNEIYGTNTYHTKLNLGICEGETEHTVKFSFPANLGIGHYSLTVAVHDGPAHTYQNYDWWDQAAIIQVIPGNHPFFTGVNYLPVTTNKMD